MMIVQFDGEIALILSVVEGYGPSFDCSECARMWVFSAFLRELALPAGIGAVR
jgi:hypothetical protein